MDMHKSKEVGATAAICSATYVFIVQESLDFRFEKDQSLRLHVSKRPCLGGKYHLRL